MSFLRKKAGKNQNEIAVLLKFSNRGRYSNYENGASKPDFDTLIAISELFKIKIDDLLYTDLSKEKTYKQPLEYSVVAETQVNYSTENRLPLIPFEAMAGFANGIDNPVLTTNCEYYSVPEFNKKADYLIRINGSSMYPKYNSGDIIACKKLPIDTFFQWNKTYVIDTIQGALVKRVNKGSSEEFIRLVSDNASYSDFEINLKDIHALALVVGVIRFE